MFRLLLSNIADYEDILVSVVYFLRQQPTAKFLTTYHIRSYAPLLSWILTLQVNGEVVLSSTKVGPAIQNTSTS